MEWFLLFIMSPFLPYLVSVNEIADGWGAAELQEVTGGTNHEMGTCSTSKTAFSLVAKVRVTRAHAVEPE